MTNSKFTLFVKLDDTGFGASLGARVFDSATLELVVRGIKNGVFGHYGRQRYYLVPITVPSGPFMVNDAASLQLFPKGGRLINPKVLGHFYLNLNFIEL